MTGFARTRDGIVARFDPVENKLLRSFADQIIDLLSFDEMVDDVLPDESDGTDPFTHWAAEMANQWTLDDSDPLVRRLFPNAYADDPIAAEEFRHFTMDEQRRAKVRDARVVAAALARSRDGKRPVKVPPDEVDAWLKTLATIRLALSVRLEVVDAETEEALHYLPDDDPRSFLASVYGWLAYCLESLLAVLAQESRN